MSSLSIAIAISRGNHRVTHLLKDTAIAPASALSIVVTLAISRGSHPLLSSLLKTLDQKVSRRQHGLNIVGADLVEVSPPYDQAGTTALVGANLLYEMLCVLPGVQRKP